MDADFFLSKIRQELPEVKWTKYKYITHGWDHVVVILDNKLVFRMPKEVTKESKGEFYSEIQLLDFLKTRVKTGIPEYLYISKDKSLAGYKILEGRELTKTIFNKMGAEEKNKVATQLAEFLTTLHTIPNSALHKFKVRKEDSKKSYNWLVSDVTKYVFPRLSLVEIEKIIKYFKEYKSALGLKFTPVLRHGDVGTDHLLWDRKKQCLNIIDFADRSYGDPASDFAGLWQYGSDFVNKVYSRYKGKKDDKLLYRSQLYFKRSPLSVLKGSLTGAPCTFEEGCRMFKQRFV